MIEHTLTFRTNVYNFYRTYDLDTILYHIVKKGEPMPTTGYTHPEQIMYLTGNLKLDIMEVFKLSSTDKVLLFKKNHFNK
jgi:hypothetical protein